MEDDDARLMNSQFTSLRTVQSAEGYSGVKWPLALLRRAHQLRSCNFRKCHKTVLACLRKTIRVAMCFPLCCTPKSSAAVFTNSFCSLVLCVCDTVQELLFSPPLFSLCAVSEFPMNFTSINSRCTESCTILFI